MDKSVSLTSSNSALSSEARPQPPRIRSAAKTAKTMNRRIAAAYHSLGPRSAAGLALDGDDQAGLAHPGVAQRTEDIGEPSVHPGR